MKRVRVYISGIVQGVGFRPFIYGTAMKHDMNGFVANSSSGVVIEFEGREQDILEALEFVRSKPPTGAQINSLTVNEIPLENDKDFRIIESIKSEGESISLSPDIAICEDCRREMEDKNSRFYKYPFISCAHCGPRLTILEGLPYDRPYTTMKPFNLCTECKKEYEDPNNRRYHAQTISCSNCGPRLHMSGEGEPLTRAYNMLSEGKIIGIKGIGGYHIACDASNDDTVKVLRQRKKREFKPFAVMMNLNKIYDHCHISEFERKLLLSPQSPIVLLRQKESSNISKNVNPNLNVLGIMLPYTGIHKLLLDKIEALVMTSGNNSGDSIVMSEDNLDEIKGICDDILTHDREITFGCDDSIVRAFDENYITIRRARGFTPIGIKTMESKQDILACGSDLKNTFCISKKGNSYISQYIGDLQNKSTYDRFVNTIEKYSDILKCNFKYIICDKHPGYFSTQYAKDMNLPLLQVQHHYAHIAAVLGEHNVDEPVIGVSFDGTGYGDDGNIWGGEFFVATKEGYNRKLHFEYVRMPGGEKAIIEPWRMAISYLLSSFNSLPDIAFINNLNENERKTIQKQITTGFNSPYTSSAGRLFEGIGALLNIQRVNTYEGQSAVELESIYEVCDDEYDFEIGNHEIYIKYLIEGIVNDIKNNKSPSVISGKFHNTIASIIVNSCININKLYHIKKVALGGGVFQNIRLMKETIRKLNQEGFEVLYNNKIPLNDGGISFGQMIHGIYNLK